jgi:hypothetical protein
MSRAVFAKYLNLTVGYLSKLERGVEMPIGAALACSTSCAGSAYRRFLNAPGCS